MKNLFFLIFFLAGVSSAIAQTAPDTIITHKQERIPCKILDLDAKTQAIIYALPDNEKAYFIPFTDVYQYYWDGELILAVGRISKSDSKRRKGYDDDLYATGSPEPARTPLVYASKETYQQQAGDELVKFADMAQLGIGMQIGAGLLIGLSATMDAEAKGKDGLIYAGAGIGFVGFIIQTVSYSNARKAGRLLRISTSQDGIGLSMPIK